MEYKTGEELCKEYVIRLSKLGNSIFYTISCAYSKYGNLVGIKTIDKIATEVYSN